jgi:hypothetical protein
LVGPTLIASATGQGKFVARLDAPPRGSSGRWSGRIVELDATFADEPGQVANVQRFYDVLEKNDFLPEQTSFATPLPAELPEGFSIAGNTRCAECHPEDCRLWESSKHANAWKSLKEKGAHVDPGCQRCHTTGYGLPGGFASFGPAEERRPRVANVGCESCHGPSAGHVEQPEVRTAHFGRAKDHCTACHDRENSPQFEYDGYWAQVRHGTSPTVGAEKARGEMP